MSQLANDLQQFHSFALGRIEAGEDDASLEELFSLWRESRTVPELAGEDRDAVAAAIDDFLRGDRGRPAGITSQELRSGQHR